MNKDDIKRCPGCHVVKEDQITTELYPLEIIDSREPVIYYCKICGFLYTDDEDGELDTGGLINIKKTLLIPEIKKVKKYIAAKIFEIFDTIFEQEKNSYPPAYIPKEYINKVKETIESNIDCDII